MLRIFPKQSYLLFWQNTCSRIHLYHEKVVALSLIDNWGFLDKNCIFFDTGSFCSGCRDMFLYQKDPTFAREVNPFCGGIFDRFRVHCDLPALLRWMSSPGKERHGLLKRLISVERWQVVIKVARNITFYSKNFSTWVSGELGTFTGTLMNPVTEL